VFSLEAIAIELAPVLDEVLAEVAGDEREARLR
jgi:hypothetical protein